MRVKKFTTSLVFFSIAAFSTAYAMEVPKDTNDVKCWLPIRLHAFSDEIDKLVKNEMQCGRIRIENNEEDVENDYGYSFPGISDIQKSFLIKVCELYSEKDIRPSVLDLGAGHGLMSWKILVAGGHLTAIEKQGPTAKKLQKKVMLSKHFISSNESIKTISCLRMGDMCSYNLDIYKPASYDVTWSGNIIHLLTPNQAIDYVENLFKITKPGGYAYASAHSATGFGVQQLTAYFLKRKKNKELYPGFFIVNRIYHYNYDSSSKTNNNYCIDIVGPFKPGISDMSPTKSAEGLYEKPRSIKKYDSSKPFNGRISRHSTVHVFDPESLSYFFIKAGFDIEAAFFIADGKRCDYNVSDKEMLNGKFAVGIVARKPAFIEEKKD